MQIIIICFKIEDIENAAGYRMSSIDCVKLCVARVIYVFSSVNACLMLLNNAVMRHIPEMTSLSVIMTNSSKNPAKPQIDLKIIRPYNVDC